MERIAENKIPNEKIAQMRKELFSSQKFISTICRISPTNREPVISIENDAVVCKGDSIKHYFKFNDVISADASQEVFYGHVNLSIQNFNNGRSQCLIAFGSSGSGKTHTIFGYDSDFGFLGHLLRNSLPIVRSPCNLAITVNEISSNGTTDLLTTLGETEMSKRIHQYTFRIRTQESIEKVIAFIRNTRATTETALNAKSSRSHIVVTVAKIIDEMPVYYTVVDCAGYEPNQSGESKMSNLYKRNVE